MKLTIKKQSKKSHHLVLKVKGKIVARTDVYDPKTGPKATVDRLNAGLKHLVTNIVGVENLGFTIHDGKGLLLESNEKSIYRNHVVAHLNAVKKLIEAGNFTASE